MQHTIRSIAAATVFTLATLALAPIARAECGPFDPPCGPYQGRPLPQPSPQLDWLKKR